MICDYPDTAKTGPISICLLHMDVQPSMNSHQLQEGEEGGRSNPLTRALPMVTVGSPPLSPPVIGFLAG